MIVLYIILAVLVLLLAGVLLRTAAFHPKAEAFLAGRIALLQRLYKR